MLGKAARTKETLPEFFENMDPEKMGHNNVISGHPKSIGIPQVDRLSTRPPKIRASRL